VCRKSVIRAVTVDVSCWSRADRCGCRTRPTCTSPYGRRHATHKGPPVFSIADARRRSVTCRLRAKASLYHADECLGRRVARRNTPPMGCVPAGPHGRGGPGCLEGHRLMSTCRSIVADHSDQQTSCRRPIKCVIHAVFFNTPALCWLSANRRRRISSSDSGHSQP
jgi:hypothetical protein